MNKFPKGLRRRVVGWLFAAAALALIISLPVYAIVSMPDQLSLTKGYRAQLNVPWPVGVDLSGDAAVHSSDDESIGGRLVQWTPQEEGLARVTVRLLNLFPVKTVNVAVGPEKIVIPGGQSIGVVIKMRGVLIVGSSDLSGAVPSPARLAGLRAGDSIETVNGLTVENSEHLGQLLAGGGEVTLGVNRDGQMLEMKVTPIYDARDGVYRLGAWVRDSTAGIGTLSFFDPDTGGFGALGHAISDIDTGSTLTVDEGEILSSAITQVRKGTSGAPGELVGEFSRSGSALGEVNQNGSYGIYGSAYSPLVNELYPDGVAIKRRSEVRLGAAQILSTLDDSGVCAAYDVEIVRLNDQNGPAQRSMVIKVTDPELLEKTGGIVQGMSGSPILQDGRIVGAVTHVFINDPTQGYGLYIEWMLDQVELESRAGWQAA